MPALVICTSNAMQTTLNSTIDAVQRIATGNGGCCDLAVVDDRRLRPKTANDGSDGGSGGGGVAHDGAGAHLQRLHLV